MLNRLMDGVALLLISSGGITLIGGIAGGATGLLSDDTPLWLAGTGCIMMYAGVSAHGLRAFARCYISRLRRRYMNAKQKDRSNG